MMKFELGRAELLWIALLCLVAWAGAVLNHSVVMLAGIGALVGSLSTLFFTARR